MLQEKEIVDKTISSIETKIRNCEVCNELKFTPEDILIIDELYEEEILDNDDMDTIRNEYSKDDDLER